MAEESLRERIENMSDEELTAFFENRAGGIDETPRTDIDDLDGVPFSERFGGNTGEIIAYCFLAIDREFDERSRRLFDEFFILKRYAHRYLVRKGLLSEGESLPAEDDAIIAFCRDRGVKNILKYFPGVLARSRVMGFLGVLYNDVTGGRDRVIPETEKYLSETEEDESRYDRATELIRAMDEGICNFAVLIWNLVSTGIYEGIYEGNRKKLVRFLVRHTKRDKASLEEMEEAARIMTALDEKRSAIRREGAADTYEHTSARLGELKAEEKAVKKQLKKLIMRDLYEKRDEAEEEYKKPDIADEIGDSIVAGIQKVTDIICAPFEWLTDKMMGL